MILSLTYEKKPLHLKASPSICSLGLRCMNLKSDTKLKTCKMLYFKTRDRYQVYFSVFEG